MSATFRVVIPPSEAAKLRDWAAWATGHGLRDRFMRALNIINYRLNFEPRETWSEEYRELSGLRLQLRFGAEDMLGVDFGVHLDESMVFVKRFSWISPKNQQRPPQ
jgi:hypothetical protein